jgi:uncharacterized protein
MPDFEDISLSRQDAYLDRLRQCPEKASDYSFINLWAWAEEHGLTWAWQDDLVWIRQSVPAPCLWAPVGPWEAVDWKTVLQRPEFRELPFIRVPQRLMDIWSSTLPGGLAVREAREHFDYLYAVPELVELKGNRFHSQKNQLNKFKKHYQHQYRDIEAASIPAVLAAQDSWCVWRDCGSVVSLGSENRAICRVLNAWNEWKGIMGAMIEVDQKIAAFTVAEAYKPDTLLIHFEKGLPDYSGIYQAINQMFLAHNPSFALVNREQDLGDVGLRQAKLSYHPVDFIQKYEVKII